MRKALFMIIMIFALILSLLLGGGMYLQSQICDDTDNTNLQIIESNAPIDALLYHHLVEGLQYESGDGMVEINLDEYDFNEILYAISRNLEWGEISVKSMYIECSETNTPARLFVPVRVYGFDSIVSGDIRLYESENTLYAEVNNLKLGRLDIDSALVSMLNAKGLITASLKQYHINSYFEGENFRAEITREELGKLIASSTADSPYKGLIMAVYNVLMLDSNSVSVDIEDLNDCTITIDLSAFAGEADNSFNTVNAFSTELLSEGQINSGDLSLISKYYVNGYDRLSDEEKAALTGTLASKYSQEEITLHKGLVERETISLTHILLTQFQVNPNYISPGFKISDEDINDMLTSMPFISTVWQYSSFKNNDCAFIMIQSIYCLIEDDTLNLYVDLNINGYVIPICAEFLCKQSPAVTVTGSLQSVSLGSHTLSEGNAKQLYGFLCKMINEDWIYTDEVALSLTIDFTNAFNDNEILTAILKNSKHIVTVCKENSIGDGGYIQITFSLLQ